MSSRALDDLLAESSEAAADLRNGRCGIHRTVLWRLRTGRRSPDLETAVKLAELTSGRVSITGWTKPVSGRPRSHEVQRTAEAA